MDENRIRESLKYGERVTLECKEAHGKIPNTVYETYSSFANTMGGLILLGVKENIGNSGSEPRFVFVGVDNPEKRIKEFWDVINSNKVSANILMEDNVGYCVVESKTIIWIDVPQADYRFKPVYINENPLKGSYKRNHEGDYHCTVEEVKAMMRDSSESGSDETLLIGYTMDDIDETCLHKYRQQYQNMNPMHAWNEENDMDFLKALGGYKKDRITKQEGLTAAGLLMFGKGEAVRERFGNIRMDYVDFTDPLPGMRWGDRLTYDGTWENNLYNYVNIILRKLETGLRKPFRLNGMVRVDDTVVHQAVREAMINMIIHADYHCTGVLKVEKYNDGFLFSNPGSLKMPVQKIYEGGHSVARNPRIQNMFRMIGYGDNNGSGFPAILNTWKKEKWRRPDLHEDIELNLVNLRLWMVSVLPQECSYELQKKFGDSFLCMSEQEQVVLATAYMEGDVSNARLQTVLGLDSIETGRILIRLTELKMLVAVNKRRWTTYHINDGFGQIDLQVDYSDPKLPIDSLNSTDQAIIKLIQAKGRIKSVDVVENVDDVSTVQGAVKAINRLIDRGIVEKCRQGRSIYYQLTDLSNEVV